MSVCPSPLDHYYWREYAARPAVRAAMPLEQRARVTLRLPRSLKGGVEASAALAGVSVEAWVARALARSVDPRVRA